MRLTTMTTPTAGTSLPAQADGAEISVLEMVQPLLGFPDRKRFALARLDETGLLCELRSLEQADLRFVVVPPAMFFPDYAPEVDEEVADLLGSEDGNDLLVLSLVTLGESPTTATANLLAPLILNHRTRRAAQVLLDDPQLSLRAPLAGR